MSNKAVTNKKVFLRTFGWPMVTVARDGAGDSKEVKWLKIMVKRT
jgi:hypothetical protein